MLLGSWHREYALLQEIEPKDSQTHIYHHLAMCLYQLMKAGRGGAVGKGVFLGTCDSGSRFLALHKSLIVSLQQKVLNDLQSTRLSHGRMLLVHPLLTLPAVSSTGDTQED